MGAVDIYHMQIAEDVISASVDNGLRDLHMVFFCLITNCGNNKTV